ncbi:kinase-like protein, partial [Amniculicola lignicola CBS 123094]
LSEAEIPYKLLGNLGFGAHGFVEKVKDVTSGNCYARKTFRADKTSLFKAQEMLRLEVQIIRELASHPHVIRVHATYISGRTLAIILQPVADGGNLTQFLADYRDLGEGHPDKLLNRQTLIRTFGCLAHSLEYLHSDSYPHKPVIRHKDIKPTNILIHEGSPIFTDFGISRRCIDNQTTTSGRPEVFTLRYCAPEVADYDDRNRKADVFSLGCVFLEILASL